MLKFSFFAESFDKSYPIKIKKSMEGYSGTAMLADGGKLFVRFEDIEDGDWELVFYRGSSSKTMSTSKTGEGDAMRIFATVISAAEQFLKKESPENIFIIAVKDDTQKTSELNSREKLYIRLANRFASKYGFSAKVKSTKHDTEIWIGKF